MLKVGISSCVTLCQKLCCLSQDIRCYRTGSLLQASGENILAAVKSFTDILASPDGDLLGENAVFFDVMGRLMVCLPHLHEQTFRSRKADKSCDT